MNPDSLTIGGPTTEGIWSRSQGRYVGIAVFKPWANNYQGVIDGHLIAGNPGGPVTIDGRSSPPTLLRPLRLTQVRNTQDDSGQQQPESPIAEYNLVAYALHDSSNDSGDNEADENQEGRVFKNYQPTRPADEPTDAHVLGVIAKLLDVFESLSQEKRIREGNEKGFIMNLDGTIHDFDYAKNHFRRYHRFVPFQGNSCRPGETCIGSCNNPSGCWYPALENPPETEMPTVRAPKIPGWFYYESWLEYNRLNPTGPYPK